MLGMAGTENSSCGKQVGKQVGSMREDVCRVDICVYTGHIYIYILIGLMDFLASHVLVESLAASHKRGGSFFTVTL